MIFLLDPDFGIHGQYLIRVNKLWFCHAVDDVSCFVRYIDTACIPARTHGYVFPVLIGGRVNH